MVNGPGNLMETQKLNLGKALVKSDVRDTIAHVIDAMKQKGYDPVGQFVGYLLSGDPTYITAYADARKRIGHFDRDELLEELVRYYLNNAPN